MKKYKLTRIMEYTETAEIQVENWDDAKAMLLGDSIEFEVQHDDVIADVQIEYLGEI